MSGLYGQPFDQFGALILADTVTDPDSTITDPVIYRKGNLAYYRAADGKVYPLVPGADGAGVVVVTHAMSPYTALVTDQTFLVDTSGGVVTVKLYPTPGNAKPARFVDSARSFATHALTIDGNGKNINGASTLAVSVQDSCPLLIYGGTTWETSPIEGSTAPSVVSVDSTMSPYAVKSTDEVLLVDSSAGAVTLTLEASPASGRQPLQIVDSTGSFASHSVTAGGNGNLIQGQPTATLSQRYGGVCLFWNGTGWTYPYSITAASDSVSGAAIQNGALRFLTSLGRNGAGAVTLSGAAAGDRVQGIVNITDHTSATSLFESTITVNNQIQQSSATDLSAKTLVYLIKSA